MTNSESLVVVEDHGEFVSARFPDGTSQTMSWHDLIRFEVQTNDSGPWGWDVWFVLVGKNDKVSFPLGAAGEDDVLDKVEHVTGKTRNELIDGMNCTENRTFVTWEKVTAT